MAIDTALVIIGAQLDIFKDVEGGLYQRQELLERLRTLVERARAADVPVVFVRYNILHPLDPLYPGQPDWHIHPALAPLADELIIDKFEADAFLNTPLQQELDARGIKRLFIAGVETDVSVDTTCRRAYSLGYHVTLLSDAHSTWPNKYLTAAQIINHHNLTLSTGFATVVPSSEVVFQAV